MWYTYPVKGTGIGAGPIQGECVLPFTSRISPALLIEQWLTSQCLTYLQTLYRVEWSDPSQQAVSYSIG